MPDDPRLRAIIEELLETGASPDDVCRDCPELLNEVRVRLRRLRQVESQIDALFPPFERTHVSEGRFDISAEERTPEVPGYRIEGVLGRGGVGLVYKAQHLKLNRPVALKMPLSGRLASPKERARFRQEAEAVASLRHTNIVHIYDVGEVEGRPYFTMEFMDGGDLAERIAGRPQSAREAATIVETLADVVSVAHDAGIVHRDLKPANVLLCSDGVLKVSDFGLARRLESAEGLTIDGHGVGTPSYMAPEQASGLAVGFCPSVDIYALGAMLYELLTGRPPFHGASAAETLRRILDDDPVPPSRIVAYAPRDLETICLKCLQKDPNQRYASAGEVRDDLSAFLAGRPIAARPSSRAERVVRWIRRNRAMSGLIGVTIALGVVASVAALREWKLAAQQRAEMTRWKERLEFVIELENEGRFDEVRAILGRVPDAGSEALRREIERAESDLNLVERLDRIRMSRGASFAGGGIDYDECARNYAAAFRESGLGSVDHPADPTADRIAASAVQATIIAALDDWAACAQARDRSWILDVARRVDPDPWRDRVRSQTDWADLDTLAELAETADVDRQPVTIMVAMSTRWRRLGGDPTAFLRRVYRRCPDDFWLNFELGLLLEQVNLEEAIGHCRAALALRPDAAIVHYNMGVYLQRLKRDDEAEFHFRQTVKADPAHVWAQLSLAAMAYNKRDWGDALDRFRVVLDIDPDNEQGWRGEQYCMIRLNRADEVQRAWQSRLAQSPTSHETWDGYAELCLYLGNEGEYRRACDELLTRFATATDPHIRERSGRACMFGELSPEKTKAAAALIDLALRGDKREYGEWAYPYFLFARSLAAYRLGRYEEAAALASGEAATILGPAPDLTLAMSLFQLGKSVEARQTLARAIQKFNWSPDEAVMREAWMYHILRREAERLIVPQVEAFLENRYSPRDNDERFAMLGACLAKQRFGLAAQLYRDAFAVDPTLTDVMEGRRFVAARLAALAGGEGADATVNDTELSRSSWRRQSRAWLREELNACASLAASGEPTRRAFCIRMLDQWASDRSLSSIRDNSERLPADEQAECRTLWLEVEALRRRLAE